MSTIERIKKSLQRQIKALSLLHRLQLEEYRLLRYGEKIHLAKHQFSIQTLLKQMEKEKKEILKLLKEEWGVQRLSDIKEKIPLPLWEEIETLTNKLKEREKTCMEQATVNADLAIAHLEQTRELAQFLYEQIKPREKFTYSRYGTFEEKTSGPYIINGRL